MTCTFYSNFLSNDISDLKYFNNGHSYILSGDGTIIASDNLDDVTNAVNVINDTENYPELEEMLQVHKNMIAGESNFEKLSDKYVTYTTIDGLDGWSIGLKVDSKYVDKEKGVIVTL
ncbi:MAG: hypothetical protein K5986_05835 [Clostridium sp.]|nr:hypothetical protein [Clostridium sp.]